MTGELTETLFFVAPRAGALLLVSLVVVAAGSRALSRMHFDNLWEEISFSGIVGLGLLGSVLFVLGSSGALYSWTVLITCAVALWAGWRSLRSIAVRVRIAATPVRIAVLVATCLLLLPLFWRALFPPHIWDALSYHLPAAKYFTQTHALGATTHLRYCVSPQLNQVLFAGGLLLIDDTIAHLLQFLSMLLTGGAMMGVSRRLGESAGTGALAVAVWVGTPLVAVLATSAYIDVGLAMFCTGAVIAYLNWRVSGQAGWLLTSGLCAGFAAASKYSGIFFVAAVAVAAILRSVKLRRWRPVAGFVLCAMVVSLPWYARNYLLSGDPIFPSSRVTNACGWSEEDFRVQEADFDRMGGGRDAASALRLPLDLAFNQQKYALEAPFSVVLPLAAPLALIALARRRLMLDALLFVSAYLVSWFLSAQVPRYLLPVLPTLALLEAVGLSALMARVSRRVLTGVMTVVALAVLAPSLLLSTRFVTKVGPLPVEARDRHRFFERYHAYPCYRYLNDQMGSQYRVLGFDPVYVSYFADGTRFGDVLGPYRYWRFPLKRGEALAGAMQRLGTALVMFSEQDVALKPPEDEYFRRHFELLCASSRSTLWRWRPFPVVRSYADASLPNGDFERGMERWSGSSASHSPGVAFRGSGSLRIEPGGSAAQAVNAVPDTLYALSLSASSDGAGAVLVRVRWIAADGEELGSTAEVFHPATDWARAEIPTRSPVGTSRAEVTFSVSGGSVWIDDVRLLTVHYNRAPDAGRP